MIDVREKAARQFSARLTGRGFESWVREGNDTYVVGGQEYMPQDLVVVRALDAAGNPVSTEVNVGIATFNLYPGYSHGRRCTWHAPDFRANGSTRIAWISPHRP